MGGFSLLDPIGYRYYLPAAMIRSLRTGGCGFSVIDFADILTASNLKIAQWEMLDDRQRRGVGRFLRFMIEESPDNEHWQRAYKSHWDRFAAPHSGQANPPGVPRRS